MCKLDHRSSALKFQCCSQPDMGRISWIKTAMSNYPNYFLGTKVLKSFGYETSMFHFPVTVHWPNATWERQKSLSDKTLPSSKCFAIFIFIIILKIWIAHVGRYFALQNIDEAWHMLGFPLPPSPPFYHAVHSVEGKHNNQKLGRPACTIEIIPTRVSNLMQQEEQTRRSKSNTTTV